VPNSLLIDTNLMILYVVGITNINQITKHKRTHSRLYTPEDFHLLVNIMRRFDRYWVTSHVLAETSNLLRQTHNELSSQLTSNLVNIVDSNFKESHYDSSELNLETNRADTALFGVTDSGILLKLNSVNNLITDDVPLSVAAERDYANKVIRFSHERSQSWVMP